MSNIERAGNIIWRCDAYNRSLRHFGAGSIVLTDKECRQLAKVGQRSYETLRANFARGERGEPTTLQEQAKVARGALVDFIVEFAETTGIAKIAKWLLQFMSPKKEGK